MKIFLILILSALFFFKVGAQNLDDSLKNRVTFLTQESLGGRVAGTHGEKVASEYLYDYLQSVGVIMLSPKSGDDFKMANNNGDTLLSRNIVGLIPGYDSRFKDEYIVLGAHYDGVIYPAAGNNASGVATLMEVAKMVSENRFIFKRSVIIAFFGGGELGNAGSWYFLNRSFSEVDKIVSMVDINSVGRSGKESPFQVFLGVPTFQSKQIVDDVSNRPFSLTATILETEPFPSDCRNFYEKNIPISLFTTGNYKFRNTYRDREDYIDYFQMSRIVEYLYTYATVLANKDKAIYSLKDETIYTQNRVEVRAKFMKGDEVDFLKNWVYRYIKYPENAVESGIQGKVDVAFVVDKEGNVIDPIIIKGLDEDIDNEVIKVIKASPKWSPAMIGGEKVAVRISLRIDFKLTKKGTIGFKK